MSGKPSSSPSSPHSGLPGLAGFTTSLRGTWRRFLWRFAAVFILLALLWLAVAPAYAQLLAAIGRPLIPWLESSPGARYLVEGTTVVAERPLLLRAPSREVEVKRQPLRDTSGEYTLALLAALLIATPGWPWRRRRQALLWSLSLLVLADLVSFLVSVEYTKLWPTRTAAGLVLSIDYSARKLILFDWLYAFFEFMGRGFFALLLYWGAVAFTWGRPEAPGLVGAVGRNDPCPCGSGMKYKRCCGA